MALTSTARAGAAQSRPLNVVLFLADDLGQRDPAVYASCPVCSPTRASVQTGRYPQRTSITDNKGPQTYEKTNPPALAHIRGTLRQRRCG